MEKNCIAAHGICYIHIFVPMYVCIELVPMYVCIELVPMYVCIELVPMYVCKKI